MIRRPAPPAGNLAGDVAEALVWLKNEVTRRAGNTR
jgi:hypothetical protein